MSTDTSEKGLEKLIMRAMTGVDGLAVPSVTQSMLAEIVVASRHSVLVALSARQEETLQFRKYPLVGPGVSAVKTT